MILVKSFPKQLSQKKVEGAHVLMKFDTVANLMMLNTIVTVIFCHFDTCHHFVQFWAIWFHNSKCMDFYETL